MWLIVVKSPIGPLIQVLAGKLPCYVPAINLISAALEAVRYIFTGHLCYEKPVYLVSSVHRKFICDENPSGMRIRWAVFEEKRY